MVDQIVIAFLGIVDEAMIILQAEVAAAAVASRQHDGRSVVDVTSTVIVKRLILGCDTTTSMMIACTPRHTSVGGIVCE
jgi:hypothetical protein